MAFGQLPRADRPGDLRVPRGRPPRRMRQDAGARGQERGTLLELRGGRGGFHLFRLHRSLVETVRQGRNLLGSQGEGLS